MTDKIESNAVVNEVDDNEAEEEEEEFVNFVSSYDNALIAISVLGGQITFTIIVTDIADPTTILPWRQGQLRIGAIFPQEKVRLLISLAWLFFTICLGIAVLTQSLLMHPSTRESLLEYRKRATELSGKHWFTLVYAAALFFGNTLPIAAFVLMSLAVTSYEPSAGWIAAIGSVMLGIASIVVFVRVAHKERKNRECTLCATSTYNSC